jgi:hypothetical protein
MKNHHYDIFPSQHEYFAFLNISCCERILISFFKVRAVCLTFAYNFYGLNMSEAAATREKRLSTGSRVSGAFGDFYANPDPNIRRRKRQRIFGVVQEACGPRKYKVLFDSGVVIECFSNTLCVETASTSIPLDELQVAVAQVERQGEESRVQSAAAIVTANKAAANDADADEHLPESPEEDDAQHSDHGEDAEDEGQQDEQQEAGQQERPVGVVSETPAEDTANYAGRKQAALRQIEALLGHQVVVARNRNDSLEWTVVAESHPAESDEGADDDYVGLKNLSEVTRARYHILIAHLFLHITFKVSFYVDELHFLL